VKISSLNLKISQLICLTVMLIQCLWLGSSVYAEELSANFIEEWVGAQKKNSYSGVFVFEDRLGLRTLRVIHSSAGGIVKEKLTYLDGSKKEIIRNETKFSIIKYDNDGHISSLGSEHEDGLSRVVQKSFPNVTKLKDHYVMSVDGEERVAGRNATKVRFMAKDDDRYSYTFWLDNDKSLTLMSELQDADGRVVERMEFLEIDFEKIIVDSEVVPLEPLNWKEGKVTSKGEGNAISDFNWQVAWLPEGFEEISISKDALPGGKGMVDSFLFSDGLFEVSVFVVAFSDLSDIEKLQEKGVVQLGATSAFVDVIELDNRKYQLLVVGELPVLSLQRIGNSIKFKK